jgi:hypothetical protein
MARGFSVAEIGRNTRMVSKILMVAEMSEQSFVSVLNAFQMIQKDQPIVKVVLPSYLSDLFKKTLGPNTVNHWTREETRCTERVKGYFDRMDIGYELIVIRVPPWQRVFQELRDGDHECIILQGDLLKIWGEDRVSCGLCFEAIHRSRCPILVTPQFVEDLLLPRSASVEAA